MYPTSTSTEPSHPGRGAIVALLALAGCDVVLGIEGDRRYASGDPAGPTSTAAAASVSASSASATAASATSSGDASSTSSGEPGAGAGGSGTGGAPASSASSGGGVGAADCVEVGAANDGPYGDAQLYFGEPEDESSLPSDFFGDGRHSVRTIGISDDGHFIAARDSPQPEIRIRRRREPFGAWEQQIDYVLGTQDRDPHLTAGGRALFSCSEDLGRCGVRLRGSLNAFFDGDFDDPGEAQFDFGPFAGPDGPGGGIDFAFVPTPDLRYVAFASNRTPAGVDFNDGGDDVVEMDLWMARAVDPADLALGYEDLHHLGEASSVSSPPPNARPAWPEEAPGWLSDDARTLVFHSGRQGDFDLFVTSGDPETGAFGEPVRIAALSEPYRFEESFTMPSIATLEQSCGRGFAYFRRFTMDQFGGASSRFMRVPVCVGAPCDE